MPDSEYANNRTIHSIILHIKQNPIYSRALAVEKLPNRVANLEASGMRGQWVGISSSEKMASKSLIII